MGSESCVGEIGVLMRSNRVSGKCQHNKGPRPGLLSTGNLSCQSVYFAYNLCMSNPDNFKDKDDFQNGAGLCWKIAIN